MATHPARRLAGLVGIIAVMAAAGCSDDSDPGAGPDETTAEDERVELVLVTHDSFNVSEEVLAAFTEETGISVDILRGGDAGSMVNQAILTKDDPQGDVLFGIDNTFLSRALDADLFVPYESSRLGAVDDALVLDEEHRVSPIDIGDVCLNYDKQALADAALEPPATLDDLVGPGYSGKLVVEDPSTSSPGLAFLLATIAEYGEDGWQAWWRQLVDNDVEIVPGWEEAYYGSFTRAGGDRPLVVSYATSPPAEVFYAEEPLDDSPTGVVEASCFRQIEFAGILSGTEHEDEAGQLIDFLLGDAFQADIPLNMFVYPVTDVELPEEFVAYGVRPAEPYALDPETIAANRDRWIREWSDLVRS